MFDQLGNVQCGTRATILVLFFYKMVESILQPTMRIYIYQHFLISKTHNVTEDEVQIEVGYYFLLCRILINFPAAFLFFFWSSFCDKLGARSLMLMPCMGGAIVLAVLSIWRSLNSFSLICLASVVYGIFGKSTILKKAIISSSDINQKFYSITNYIAIFTGTLTYIFCIKFFSFNHIVITAAALNFITTCIIVCCITEPELGEFEEIDGENIPIFQIPEYDHLLEEINEAEETDGVDFDSLYVCRKNMYSESHGKEDVAYEDSYSYVNDNSIYTLLTQNDAKRNMLLLLMCAYFVNHLCKAGESDTIFLFAMHSPLNWTADIYGYFLLLRYTCIGVGIHLNPLISKLVTRRFTSLITCVLLSQILTLALTASCKNSYLLFLAAGLELLSGTIAVCIKEFISKFIDSEQIAFLFVFSELLANVLGPIVFNIVYVLTVSLLPGLVFTVAGLFHVCLFVCFLAAQIFIKQEMIFEQ